MTITVTRTATGFLTNTASAAGNEFDPTPANNTATAGTAVILVSAADIPTLSQWGLLTLGFLPAGLGYFFLRKGSSTGA